MTDKTITLETLLDRYEGEALLDVEMVGGESAKVALLAGPKDLLADWGGGIASLLPAGMVAFTSKDGRTRWSCEDGQWTAENLGNAA